MIRNHRYIPSRSDRRAFLRRSALATAGLLAPSLWGRESFAAQSLTVPQNVQVVPTKRVLAPQDFRYLGAMRTPGTGLPSDPTFSQGALAARRVNGRLHFFGTLSNAAIPQDAVYEFADTGDYNTDYTKAQRAELVAVWGDIYQGRRVAFDKKTGTSAQVPYLVTPSLLWREDRLYWSYYNAYNVSQNWDPSIGMTTLGSQPGQVKAYGPWTLEVGPKHSSGYLLDLPGGRLGVGAPLQSGNSGSSWGPELYGLAFPDASTPAGASVPDLKVPDVYVRHDYMGDRFTAEGRLPGGEQMRSLKRPGNYIWHTPRPPLYIDPVKNDGIGSWTDVDTVDSAVYIDLPDKHGLLFVGHIGNGHIWYGVPTNCGHGIGDRCGGGTGPHASGWESRWWIYDPNTLFSSNRRQRAPWIPPAAEFDPTVAIGAFGLSCRRRFGGAYFDRDTRRLYVLAPEADDSLPNMWIPLVHVFEVE